MSFVPSSSSKRTTSESQVHPIHDPSPPVHYDLTAERTRMTDY